jgi:hypothetical protein
MKNKKIFAISFASILIICGILVGTANACEEGCTIGYWKTHQDEWQTYTPETKLNEVFSLPGFENLGEISFIEALEFKGGKGINAAARLLLKQAVAAVLNYEHDGVDYEPSTSIVIIVLMALQTSNRGFILSIKNMLDSWNNEGCPLN